MEIRPWGETPDGRAVRMAVLRNANGFEVRVSDYGAMIVGIRTPDRDGRLGEVVLGFAEFADYLAPGYREAGPYFGATVGRYANRIAGARFELDGREYVLAANEGDGQLHGGPMGFDQVVWAMEPLAGACGVALSMTSPDGDQGFPGALQVRVEMEVAEDRDTLAIRYRASTDRPTHLNLTAHPYFNLDLEGSPTVRGHQLQVLADAFTPSDPRFLPTGEIAEVAGGPLDLRLSVPLEDVLDRPELADARGLNHNFVLGMASAEAPRLAARLREARSGRWLEVWTTEPGLQVYSAGFLPALVGRRGERFGREGGVCLETQHFPDSPNQQAFPSTRLDLGAIFRSETQLRFGTDHESPGAIQGVS